MGDLLRLRQKTENANTQIRNERATEIIMAEFEMTKPSKQKPFSS